MSDTTLRRSLVAVVCVLGMLLTGCVSIPRSGSVMTGQEVSERRLDPTEFVVSGPAPGATRDQILRGFIDAYKSSGDYEVARQFLSSTFVNEWDPRQSVLVRSESSSERFVDISETAMQYVVTTDAAVDASGVYSPFPDATATLRYEFVQEAGEWRISLAPDGIVLADPAFATIFSEHVLYFLDPGAQNLVPDLRWFPSGTAATRVVSALLAGPATWLQGAVTTAFPDGTSLSSPKRVGVESGVAMVDLTVEALSSDSTTRQLMRHQLEASLSLPSISSVSISVNGAPVPIPDAGGGLPQAHPQVDSRPLILQGDQFGFYANGKITAIDQLSDKVVALGPRAATLGSSGTVAAVLGVQGASIVRSSQDAPLLLDNRPGLIAPTLDSYGYVWTVPADQPSAVRAYNFDGEHVDVVVTLPADARIRSIEVSRDGARLAVLLATGAGPRLIVAAIIRDPNNSQAPVTLGEPVLDVADGSGDAVSVTWLDEITVAVLSNVASISVVTEFRIGGERSELGNPPISAAVVGGNGESGVRVLGADGVIFARRGSGWQQTGVEAAFIAVQR
jgi:hypothetical protein